jgi:hypothetical protein
MQKPQTLIHFFSLLLLLLLLSSQDRLVRDEEAPSVLDLSSSASRVHFRHLLHFSGKQEEEEEEEEETGTKDRRERERGAGGGIV